jgi:hypothetical protein
MLTIIVDQHKLSCRLAAVCRPQVEKLCTRPQVVLQLWLWPLPLILSCWECNICQYNGNWSLKRGIESVPKTLHILYVLETEDISHTLYRKWLEKSPPLSSSIISILYGSMGKKSSVCSIFPQSFLFDFLPAFPSLLDVF